MRNIMFKPLSLPFIRLRLAWPRRAGSEHAQGALFPIGLALVLALSTVVASPSPASAAEGPQTAGPSIQYQEALSHASKEYTFAPGGIVNVPFRPRPGDTTQIDGAAPVALPAGRGSAAPTPQQAVATNGSSSLLRRAVFGFLPYWELSATLDYDALSTVAYFGVDLNTDGTLNKAGNGWNGWVGSSMTQVINDAHAHGTRVALTVESFAWGSNGAASQSALLGSPTASLTAAQQIAAEVGRRGADGVNLDFEPIAPGQYSNFVTFTRLVRSELDKVHPGYELTFCATGAPGTYDLPNLLAPGAADAVFIMGYDLRGGTPPRTGSIDPLESPYIRYDLNYVVNTFLSAVAPSKVILGLPWYGHAWSTGATNALNAPPGDIPAFGSPATGISYATAKGIADKNPANISTCSDGPPPTCIGWQYDPVEQTAWTAYYGNYGGTQNTWRELYFDDPQAVAAKLDAIDGWNLRGVGIWALGYDSNNGGDGDLIKTIAAKFEGVPTTYVPLAPARILDSRIGNGLSNAFSSHVARTLAVANRGGVPASAIAVTGNLTVTGQTSSGYLYVGPNAMNNPTSSTLNFPVGDDRANGVTVALGTGGTLGVTFVSPTAGSTAHAIFDVTGYFVPDMSGATYVALNPSRILDSRTGNGLGGPFSSHAARSFQVSGAGGVPANATAVTGNLTVTGQTGPGYLYIGPVATDNPTSSTLNFPRGDDRANGVTVALSAGGILGVTFVTPVSGSTANAIFDMTGYFVPDTSGAKYVPLIPSRILDTRSGNNLSGPFSSHAARTFGVTGHGGVPTEATAVTGNLTVTGETSLGYLYMGPLAMNNPTSSTLNFPPGDDRANGVTVAIGAGGTQSITFVAPAPGPIANVIFDVTGYFVP
jgi:spore germination protein YaaH